jgi:hypothetical protein
MSPLVYDRRAGRTYVLPLRRHGDPPPDYSDLIPAGCFACPGYCWVCGEPNDAADPLSSEPCSDACRQVAAGDPQGRRAAAARLGWRRRKDRQRRARALRARVDAAQARWRGAA